MVGETPRTDYQPCAGCGTIINTARFDKCCDNTCKIKADYPGVDWRKLLEDK